MSFVQQNSLQVTVKAAPTSGMDARAPVGNLPDENSVYTYNLSPAEYGLLLRPGYREHAVGLDTGGGNANSGVLTIMPFTGVRPGGDDDYLFAVTNEGIWDATDFDTAPTLVQAFTDTGPGAGHGVYCHYVNDAGRDYLLYADAKNGLFEFDNDIAAGTWGRPAITGPTDLADVVFCMVHKQRLWLIEESTSSGWYLPIGAKEGAATQFHFGGKFPHGGRLYALYNWTVDGGLGMDDFLVAIATSGDVIVYQGDDPVVTDGSRPWTTTGTYYIGDIPEGRRFGSEYSGDLYLLSAFGLISMADLLKGVDSANPAKNSLAFKVARPLRQDIREKIDELGWEPIFLPPLGQLVITTPKKDDPRYIQYTMNLAVEGWGLWRDVPAQCMEDYQGTVYFGTADNRICSMSTTLDDVTLSEPPDGANGKPVEFSILSNYSHMGQPGLFKQAEFVRPNFWATTPPEYATKVLYDYDYGEPLLTPAAPAISGDAWAPPGAGTGGAYAHWDAAIWSGLAGKGQFSLIGAGGIGRSFGIAMRGSARTELRFVNWDIMWKSGGPV